MLSALLAILLKNNMLCIYILIYILNDNPIPIYNEK